MEYMIPDLDGKVDLVWFVVVNTTKIERLFVILSFYLLQTIGLGMICLEQFPLDYKGGCTKCVSLRWE